MRSRTLFQLSRDRSVTMHSAMLTCEGWLGQLVFERQLKPSNEIDHWQQRNRSTKKVARKSQGNDRTTTCVACVWQAIVDCPQRLFKEVCSLDSCLPHLLVELLSAAPTVLIAPVKTGDIHSIQSKSKLKGFVHRNRAPLDGNCYIDPAGIPTEYTAGITNGLSVKM